MNLSPIFASILMQDDSAIIAGVSIFLACCGLIVAILFIAAMWKIFSKAGQPGWAAIIPIYNLYISTQITGREAWWTLLYWILPILWFIDLGLVFGRSIIFGVITFLISGIPLLFLGNSCCSIATDWLNAASELPSILSERHSPVLAQPARMTAVTTTLDFHMLPPGITPLRATDFRVPAS